MTLNNPCDHETDGKRDKHFGMLIARFEGILQRGNRVTVYLNGGHQFFGDLKIDNKGYMVCIHAPVSHTLRTTYIELGDVVAIMEHIGERSEDKEDA